MYLLKHKSISGIVNQFDIEQSEDLLMVYESCINYVLENCNDEQIYQITGVENADNLKQFQKDINSILFYYANKGLLSSRQLKQENRQTTKDELLYLGIDLGNLDKITVTR